MKISFFNATKKIFCLMCFAVFAVSCKGKKDAPPAFSNPMAEAFMDAQKNTAAKKTSFSF